MLFCSSVARVVSLPSRTELVFGAQLSCWLLVVKIFDHWFTASFWPRVLQILISDTLSYTSLIFNGIIIFEPVEGLTCLRQTHFPKLYVILLVIVLRGPMIHLTLAFDLLLRQVLQVVVVAFNIRHRLLIYLFLPHPLCFVLLV